MIWLAALVALLVGVAAGPALDRLAHWSLGIRSDPDQDAAVAEGRPWRRRPLATGLIAGVAGVAVVLLVPSPSLLPAWLALAVIAAPITRTDLARHRIPDVLNAVAFGAGAVLLLLPADPSAYGRAWLGALAVTAFLLVLALIGPTGLGMGDVKLGPALGLYLGFLGWESVLIGIFGGFVLGALAGIALVLGQAARGRPVRGALRRALPFGPFLLAGALAGLAA